MPKVIGTRERIPFYESPWRPPVRAQAPVPNRACAYCKTRLAHDVLVCRNCGAPVPPEP